MTKNRLTLDVGCGMNKRGDIGVDYRRSSNADIIADAHNLPLKNESFGMCMSSVVLEHSPNPLNFLQEQYRILEKGGEISVVTDNAQYHRWTVLNPAMGGVSHENMWQDHYMVFFPLNVKRLLQDAGFKIQSFQYLFRSTHPLSILLKVLAKLGLLREECLYVRFEFKAVKP